METDTKKLTFDNLRRMSHPELKKLAKEHGIKANMKVSKIIDALNSIDADDLNDSDDFTSFSTPPQQDINSSKKKKEEKFNEDQKTPMATPRRGTYSIDTPVPVKLEDSFASMASSDALPIFDISNVTMSRGSERKLRPRKVSFMSPVKSRSSTPKNSSIKRRPKTPVASRTPVIREEESFADPAVEEKENRTEKSKGNTKSHISKEETSAKKQRTITPSNAKLHISKDTSAKKQRTATPSNSKLHISEETSAKIQRTTTPINAKLHVSKETSAKKIQRTATPNFKKIHEEAFNKMESIVEYQKRKAKNSAKKIDQRPNLKLKANQYKSKIPAFAGIPFKSAVQNSAPTSLRLDSKPSTEVVPVVDKKKVKDSGRNKAKFDLKASLSRKLSYKPYTGPLKPLAESNTTMYSFHEPKEPVNKVVQQKRFQHRSALKGVRTNKRFELQMKNRNLN